MIYEEFEKLTQSYINFLDEMDIILKDYFEWYNQKHQTNYRYELFEFRELFDDGLIFNACDEYNDHTTFFIPNDFIYHREDWLEEERLKEERFLQENKVQQEKDQAENRRAEINMLQKLKEKYPNE